MAFDREEFPLRDRHAAVLLQFRLQRHLAAFDMGEHQAGRQLRQLIGPTFVKGDRAVHHLCHDSSHVIVQDEIHQERPTGSPERKHELRHAFNFHRPIGIAIEI